MSGPPTGALERALSPARIGPIALRNRVIKTATYEGMTPGGRVGPRLIRHHVELARGGVGLTTVAYAAVSPEGRTFDDQLLVEPGAVEGLRALTQAIHDAGGRASLQLAHCGGFTKRRAGRPRGPSLGLNLYGLLSGVPLVYPMRARHLERVRDAFRRAAGLAAEAGFDALEIHLGHGYLLSQFLSPATNRRRDRYGGTLEGRARLPLEVLEAVRAETGGALALLAKINLSDGFRGGLRLRDAVGLGRMIEARGAADALVLSGGFVSRNAFYLLRGGRPLRDMIAVEGRLSQKIALALFGPAVVQRWPFSELFFLPLARELRRALELPLVLLGGVVSAENVARAMDEGFDFVALGRALLADPDLVRRMERDPHARSRCIHCNRCVAEMDRERGVRCVLDP